MPTMTWDAFFTEAYGLLESVADDVGEDVVNAALTEFWSDWYDEDLSPEEMISDVLGRGMLAVHGPGDAS